MRYELEKGLFICSSEGTASQGKAMSNRAKKNAKQVNDNFDPEKLLSNKKNDRPSWDEVWMTMAETISLRSTSKNFKVGAVVVSNDNTQVLSLGYNGNYAGGPNDEESQEPGNSGFIHAEVNALLKLDYNNPKKKVIYLTLSPCKQCAKCLVNAGIDEVVYKNEYRDLSGVELLKESGIVVRKFS